MKYSRLLFLFIITYILSYEVKSASVEEKIKRVYIRHLTDEGNQGIYVAHNVSRSNDILMQILGPEAVQSFEIVYANLHGTISFEEFKALLKEGETKLTAYLVRKKTS